MQSQSGKGGPDREGGPDLKQILSSLGTRFDGSTLGHVNQAVQKLWNEPPTRGLLEDGVKASLEDARRNLFTPSRGDIERHVELVSLRESKQYREAALGKAKYSDSVADLKALDADRRKLLVGVLAVMYHCYEDTSIIAFAEAGGLMRLFDLLSVQPLVLRFWSLMLLSRLFKLPIWQNASFATHFPALGAAVRSTTFTNIVANLGSNAGGEFSAECLQIFVFWVEFSALNYAEAQKPLRPAILAAFKRWVEQTTGDKDREGENKIALQMLSKYSRVFEGTAATESKPATAVRVETAASEADEEKRKGNAAFRKRDMDLAIRHYTAAIEAARASGEPRAAYYSNRANATMQKSKSTRDGLLRAQLLSSVVADCDSALAQKSGYQKAIYRKGLALEQLGRVEEAIAALGQLKVKDAAVERVLRRLSIGDADKIGKS